MMCDIRGDAIQASIHDRDIDYALRDRLRWMIDYGDYGLGVLDEYCVGGSLVIFDSMSNVIAYLSFNDHP